jgi:uncharacterized protein YbaP (TraB family)
MKQLFIAALLCCTLLGYAQTEKKWPPALLWRITGNGFTKPSYLYGTIHLQQKELFYFGDSVYNALEKTDGFAMEVDPNEMIRVVYEQLFAQDDEEEEDEETDLLKEKTGKGLAIDNKAPPKKTGFRIKSLSKPGISKEKMSAIVDIYLYEWARSKNKWLGGLENINDHIGYIDELGRGIRKKALLPQTNINELSLQDTLVALYLRQDLDKIHKLIFSDIDYSDPAFVQRNKVMAQMADSLGRERSMFYAVGTAHLPGDSGVISLLRQRGFEVTPVFSSKKLPPVKKINNDDKWVTYWDKDSTYHFQAPVNPGIYSPGATNMEMKIAVDIFNQAAYFFITFTQPVPSNNQPEDHFLTLAIERMQKKGIPAKKITKTKYQQFPAITAVINRDGIDFSVQLVQNGTDVYMMFAGSEQRTGVDEKLVTRFFNSLDILKRTAIKEKEWITYTDSTDYFSIKCPCVLKTKKENTADANKTYLETACFDTYTQTNYSVGHIRMKPGNYNSLDTSFFTSYLGVLKEMAGKDGVDMRTYSFSSYPAAEYKLTSEDIYKLTVNIVIKGNIIYIIGTTNASDNISGNNPFLQSLQLLPTGEDHWKKQIHPDGNLSLFAPGPFVPKPDAEEEASAIDTTTNITTTGVQKNKKKELDYFACDTHTATSYFIFKTAYTPYQWFQSDSAWAETVFRNALVSAVKDSVIFKNYYRQSGIPIAEIVKTCDMLNTWQHLKFFVIADTLHEIQSYITRQQYQSPAHQKLYNDIEILHPHSTTIFTNKSKILFEALASADSLIHAAAKEALSNNTFTKNELPLLHQAMLQHYPRNDKATYNNTGYALVETIEPLADSSTVSFIRDNYMNFDTSTAVYPDDLLYLLAKQKTIAATQLLKELLLNHTPAKTGNFRLGWALTDSLQLAVQLFPEIARLLGDTNYQFITIRLLDVLTDSSLLPFSFIRTYEKQVCNIAATVLKKYQADSETYQPNISELIGLLAKLKTPESLRLLDAIGKLKPEYLKYNVLEKSVKQNIPANPAILQKLAASRYYRIDAYKILKEAGQEKRFPPAYATQDAIAESLLYNYADESEEMTPVKMQLIKEVMAPYKGKQYRFFVYKLRFESDEDNVWYMGFSGPFATDRKKLTPVENIYNTEWIDFDTTFKTSDIQKKLKGYLAQLTD